MKGAFCLEAGDMKYDFISRTKDILQPDAGVLRAVGGNELLGRIVQARLEAIHEEEKRLSGAASDSGTLPERAARFLKPEWGQLLDPMAFRDMERATRLIRDASKSGRPVRIYGDYDVDGTAASAILALALRRLGISADVDLPSRTGSGYGLNAQAVEEMPPGSLLITVDCGITATSEVRLAREKGIDVILTDHHEPLEDLPESTCLLNPRVPGETYPNKCICGAGIAFKMAQALLGDGARELVDLAAVATLADVVLQNEENRAITALGIQKLNAAPSPGLAALASAIWPNGRKIMSSDVSFSIVPVLNAAGRVASARLAFDLLSTVSPQIAKAIIAPSLLENNEKRKRIQEHDVRDALSQLEGKKLPYFIVLYSDDWHPGVLGLVAAKVAERHARPALVLTKIDGQYVGSARTAGGIHLQQALSQFSSLLVKFGGHAAAAGVTVLPENLPALRNELDTYARKRKEQLAQIPQFKYDVAQPMPVPDDLCAAFSRLEPFGHGCEEPVVLVQDALISDVRGMRGGAHSSFSVSTGGPSSRAVAFGSAPSSIPAVADVAGTVQMSSFSGRPELIVRAISSKDASKADDFFAQALDNIRYRSRSLPASTYFRDKPRLGLIYSAIAATTPAEGGMSRNDLYVAMRAKIPDLRREETAFAWAVFSELHLITGLLDDNIKVTPRKGKQNLEDSRVFAAFKRYALAASNTQPGHGV